MLLRNVSPRVEKSSKKEFLSNAKHNKLHTHSRVKGPIPVETSPSEADLRQDSSDAAQSERVGILQEEEGVSTYGNEGGGVFLDEFNEMQDNYQRVMGRMEESNRHRDGRMELCEELATKIRLRMWLNAMRTNASGGYGTSTTNAILEADDDLAHRGNLKADILLFDSTFRPEGAEFKQLYTVSLEEAKGLDKEKDADIIDVLNAKATCLAECWDIPSEMGNHWDTMLLALKPDGWRPDAFAASREAFLRAFGELVEAKAEEREAKERKADFAERSNSYPHRGTVSLVGPARSRLVSSHSLVRL